MADFTGVIYHRYQIQRQLSQKAGRLTLIAFDWETEQQVVLKVLLFSQAVSWDEYKLFEREVRTLQSLSHPFIPQYLNSFEWDFSGNPGLVLVQTYIHAPSLEGFLTSGRRFTEAELKELALKILDILIYLQQQNPPIIHRDIKPSNILLANRSGNSIGDVYLVDFGAVKSVALEEGTMTIVGTYGYLPPEQFRGQSVPASDLYSLGATLIHLATGIAPIKLLEEDGRINFPTSTLSYDFARLLLWMAEPILKLRLKNAQEAKQALEGKLTLPTNLSNELEIVKERPEGSSILLQKTAEKIEIIIPVNQKNRLTQSEIAKSAFPQKPPRKIPNFIGIAVGSCCALVLFSFTSIFIGIFFSWLIVPLLNYLLSLFPAIDPLKPFFLYTYLIALAIGIIYAVLFNRYGRKRFIIDHQKMLILDELFDWIWQEKVNPQIVKITYNHRYFTKDSDGAKTEQSPKLTLWTGTQKHEITAPSDPEIEWLAYEVSQWLRLPLTLVD